ncbi:hypothetical protein ONZ45_g18080 [Pleurotus djamor]|nr:hypothetical protein ONZ45_g18080 [Pleurotus djamor]
MGQVPCYCIRCRGRLVCTKTRANHRDRRRDPKHKLETYSEWKQRTGASDNPPQRQVQQRLQQSEVPTSPPPADAILSTQNEPELAENGLHDPPAPAPDLPMVETAEIEVDCAPDSVQRYVYDSLRSRFEEFTFCDGDWKAERYCTVKYPDWCQTHRKWLPSSGDSPSPESYPNHPPPSSSSSKRRRCNHQNSSKNAKRSRIDKGKGRAISEELDSPPPPVIEIKDDEAEDIRSSPFTDQTPPPRPAVASSSGSTSSLVALVPTIQAVPLGSPERRSDLSPPPQAISAPVSTARNVSLTPTTATTTAATPPSNQVNTSGPTSFVDPLAGLTVPPIVIPPQPAAPNTPPPLDPIATN